MRLAQASRPDQLARTLALSLLGPVRFHRFLRLRVRVPRAQARWCEALQYLIVSTRSSAVSTLSQLPDDSQQRHFPYKLQLCCERFVSVHWSVSLCAVSPSYFLAKGLVEPHINGRNGAIALCVCLYVYNYNIAPYTVQLELPLRNFLENLPTSAFVLRNDRLIYIFMYEYSIGMLDNFTNIKIESFEKYA